MKRINWKLLPLVGLMSFSLGAEAVSRARTCAVVLVAVTDAKAMADLQWRQAFSYPLTGGNLIGSSTAREKKIKAQVKSMTNDVYKNGTTPGVAFFEVKGPTLNDTGNGPSDQYGSAPDYEVTGLSATKGVLHGSILLPVSGHDGAASAKAWATTDKLNLFYLDGSGKQHNILAHVKSIGPVSVAEVAIPLEAGKMVSLQYYRDGSAGVYGFPSGRIVQFRWDGK